MIITSIFFIVTERQGWYDCTVTEEHSRPTHRGWYSDRVFRSTGLTIVMAVNQLLTEKAQDEGGGLFGVTPGTVGLDSYRVPEYSKLLSRLGFPANGVHEISGRVAPRNTYIPRGVSE